MNLWTDASVAALREHLDDELSAGQSAQLLTEKFGPIYSRNAVIGKRARLGLKSKYAPAQSKPPRPQRKWMAPQLITRIQANPAPQLDPIPETQILPFCEPVTLLGALEHHCRWPIGDPLTEDFRFCGGRKRPDSSYCSAHHAIGRTPARATMERSKFALPGRRPAQLNGRDFNSVGWEG